jgi:hypothetical protein
MVAHILYVQTRFLVLQYDVPAWSEARLQNLLVEKKISRYVWSVNLPL